MKKEIANLHTNSIYLTTNWNGLVSEPLFEQQYESHMHAWVLLNFKEQYRSNGFLIYQIDTIYVLLRFEENRSWGTF